MKFRTGFVSNSSTSSYVLIIHKEDYDKLMDQTHPLAHKMADGLRWKEKQLKETPIKVLTWKEGNDSSLEWMIDDEWKTANAKLIDQYCKDKKLENNYNDCYSCWEDFTDTAKKFGLVISH